MTDIQARSNTYSQSGMNSIANYQGVVPEKMRKKVEQAVKIVLTSPNIDIDTKLYVPGVTTLLTLPVEVVGLVKQWIDARFSQDKETKDNILRRVKVLPPALICAAVSILTTVVNVGALFHAFITLAKAPLLAVCVGAVNVLALGLAAVELFLQGQDFQKELKFFEELGGFDPTDQSMVEVLSALGSKYIQQNSIELSTQTRTAIRTLSKKDSNLENISTKEEEELTRLLIRDVAQKPNYLKHRVRSFAFEELKTALDSGVLDRLTDSTATPTEKAAALKEGHALLQMLRTQNKKKILVHAFGMATALTAIVSLGLLFTTCPWIIPIALMGAYGVAYGGMFLIARGALDQKGWSFSLQACLPKPVQSVIEKIDDILLVLFGVGKSKNPNTLGHIGS